MRIHFTIAIILALASSGCRSVIRGRPTPLPIGLATTLETQNLSGQLKQIQCDIIKYDKKSCEKQNNESCEKQKKQYRNKVIEAYIFLIDKSFNEYELDLRSQGIWSGVTADWVNLAIGLASTTMGSASTKSILTSINTSLTAGKTAFDKQTLFEKSNWVADHSGGTWSQMRSELAEGKPHGEILALASGWHRNHPQRLLSLPGSSMH